MGFIVNDKLIFIGSFQLIISSLDSLIKNLNEDNFKYLSRKEQIRFS